MLILSPRFPFVQRDACIAELDLINFCLYLTRSFLTSGASLNSCARGKAEAIGPRDNLSTAMLEGCYPRGLYL